MINYLIGNGSKKWRNLSTPCVWEGWWSGTITKMVKGIASWEFPKEQSLVEDKPESGTQKYSKCQTPPYEKNKLLLNEYLARLPRKGFKGKFDSQKIFQWNLSNYGLRIVKC